MSALEDLWLWLQGRNSRIEAGPEAIDAVAEPPQANAVQDDPAAAARKADLAAREQRHARYRAGPWQMK